MFDNLMGFIFMICYLMDPYIVAFKFRPLGTESINIFQRSVTYIIVIDIFVTLFTGLPKEEYLNMKPDAAQ